jgi:NAD(P)-dependent dehydrogenase (short-subunit alcohol dehydrogenase family)
MANPADNHAIGEPPAVLVTGSSRGLGRGAAIELAKGGYSVAIHFAENESAARESLALCAAAAVSGAQRFGMFRCDISDAAQREKLVEDVCSQFGGLDALVNNAGMAPRQRRDIVDAAEESFEEVLRTNLQGPYFLTQAVARRWLGERRPSRIASGRKIVFVTSISAETASTGRGEYCISKAGLSMAARLWAARLADSGMQVYELRPGIMETDMTSAVKDKYDALIGGGVVPQRRWGLPEDVGKAVRSLLDGDFPFSTGTVIGIDGGFHLSRL